MEKTVRSRNEIAKDYLDSEILRVGPHVQDWPRSINNAYLAAGIGLHVRCVELISTTFVNYQYAWRGSSHQSHNPRRGARVRDAERIYVSTEEIKG